MILELFYHVRKAVSPWVVHDRRVDPQLLSGRICDAPPSCQHQAHNDIVCSRHLSLPPVCRKPNLSFLWLSIGLERFVLSVGHWEDCSGEIAFEPASDIAVSIVFSSSLFQEGTVLFVVDHLADCYHM